MYIVTQNLYLNKPVLLTFYLSKISQVPKNIKQQLFPTLIINHHIIMICEESRDTEDWSNDAEN